LFRAWLDQHGGMVLKVARAYTLTADDCQDLMQEILLQVWRSLAQFEGRATAAIRDSRAARAGGEQSAALRKPRTDRAIVWCDPSAAQSGGGASAAVSGGLELSANGRSARYFREQRGREAESSQKGSGRADEG